MSTTLRVKRNDVGRELRDVLLLDDAPINLTDCTIVFVMKNTADGTVIRKDGELTDAAAGRVKVTLGADETALAATYQAEWEVTFVGGNVLTVPDDGYHVLEIVEDLS